MPCEVLLSPEDVEETSKILCHQNFPSLPPVTACFGDSGGPMVVCEGDRIVVIGVSSFGWHPNGHRCQKDKNVGAYIDVQAHLQWIRKTIGDGND